MKNKELLFSELNEEDLAAIRGPSGISKGLLLAILGGIHVLEFQNIQFF